MYVASDLLLYLMQACVHKVVEKLKEKDPPSQ